MSYYILDASALIALLQNEEGADKTAAVINAAQRDEAKVFMSKLNLLEVYYDTYRSLGKEQANIMLAEMEKHPVTIHHDISDEVFEEAGRLKASYRISLADAIALAETSVSGGILLTSDRHEMEIVEKSENIRIQWIR